MATKPVKYQLKSILGVAFGIAVGIGGTIGVGILRTPGDIAGLLNNPWLIIACWVLGGVYVLLGVGSYAELAAMLPKAGGAYNYVKRAFGDYAGFVTGWFDYLINAISPAYFCLVISEYLVMLFPLLKDFKLIISLTLLILFTLIHLRDIKTGSIIQQITSFTKVILFAILIFSLFVFSGVKSHNFSNQDVPGSILRGGILIAFLKSLQLVVGTYDGWMGACFFAEEDKNPGKNIPRSLFFGALIVMFTYVSLNVAFLYVMPIQTMSKSSLVASDATRLIFGDTGANLVIVISIISLISILNVYMMIPARILFGLSRDGFFIRKAATINKGGTPAIALLLSSLLSLVLIIVGSFDMLFSLGAFITLVVLGLTYFSLIKLRIKEPQLLRPYRSWGYPWATYIMILITVGLFIGFGLADQKSLVFIVAFTLLSFPVFKLLTKLNKVP
jgi:APA family basic amino acid/polyamine antiporter